MTHKTFEFLERHADGLEQLCGEMIMSLESISNRKFLNLSPEVATNVYFTVGQWRARFDALTKDSAPLDIVLR